MKTSLLTAFLALASDSAHADGFGWKGSCSDKAPRGASLEILPWDDDAHVIIQGGMNGLAILANEVVSVSTFDQGARTFEFLGDGTNARSNVKSIIVSRKSVAIDAPATAEVTYKAGDQESMTCRSFGITNE